MSERGYVYLIHTSHILINYNKHYNNNITINLGDQINMKFTGISFYYVLLLFVLPGMDPPGVCGGGGGGGGGGVLEVEIFTNTLKKNEGKIVIQENLS